MIFLLTFTNFSDNIQSSNETQATHQTKREENKTMKYRIVTKEGKEIMKSETYAGCENYWNACNGIYIDDNCEEHYIYIEEIA